MSLSSFFNVVCGDDNGCLVRGNLKQMMPNPVANLHSSNIINHVIITWTDLDLSSGSTPTVGSSRMSNGGFCSMATAKENLLCCPPLDNGGKLGWRLVLSSPCAYLKPLMSLLLCGSSRNSRRKCILFLISLTLILFSIPK